jgi:hypothetical protein
VLNRHEKKIAQAKLNLEKKYPYMFETQDKEEVAGIGNANEKR